MAILLARSSSYLLTTFVWIWVSFPTTHWFVSCPATTTYLCWLCHSTLPDKENSFVCLITVTFLSTIVWLFSLAILHGMHLVVPTHLSLFWMVCYPSRTFSLKEFEWEHQNRHFLLLTVKPYTLLPLTHNPPLLYWLGIGWWCLGLMHAPFPCMSKACLLLMRLSWTGGLPTRSAAHSWSLVAWTVFWSSILYGLLPLRVGPSSIMGFSPF